MESAQLETKYGLPAEVEFCRKCVMSNQRPCSVSELRHTVDQKKQTLFIDEEGVCDACRYGELKDHEVDWEKREKELVELLDRYRRHDGQYDCLAPGSGGKDSAVASHILKYKYGMHPLTVTWAPHMYTDIGWRNFNQWIDVGGFDNILFKPNGRVHRLLTRLAVENLFHPFQPFIVGQKNIAPKIAEKYGIKLIFYGENEAEYGNPIADNQSSQMKSSLYTAREDEFDDLMLGGITVRELRGRYGVDRNDLEAYFPLDRDRFAKAGVDFRYLGYYIKWTPQENYYYAVDHCGFEANPERTEGTFSKYNSLDDKIDGFHYWTTYIKFGLGRASYEASQEIRNHHLTRGEGVALVRRFDGEFPERYYKEFLEYIDMDEARFLELADSFRSPHLWKKENNQYLLRHQVQ